MRVKEIIDEDFSNYKKCSMLIGTCFCTWKCCEDMRVDRSICQNLGFANYEIIDMPDKAIVDRYLKNPLSSAVVFGGLEPMEQFDEVISLMRAFREQTEDEIVIYTGFYLEEIQSKVDQLREIPNIIMKFGRFKTNGIPHRDEILGVELANEEQFAVKIS